MTHYLLTIEQADGEVNIGGGVSEKYVDTKINELNNKIDTKTTMDEVKDVLSDQYTSKLTFDSTLSGYTTTNDLKENILTNYAKTIITDNINNTLTSSTSISPGHKHTINDLTDFDVIETKNNEQDERLNTIESELPNKADLTDFATIETKNTEQDERLNTIESKLPKKANISHTHTVADITDFVSPDLSDYAKITVEGGYKTLIIGDVFIKSDYDELSDNTVNNMTIGIKKTDGDVILFHSYVNEANKTIYVYDDLNVEDTIYTKGSIVADGLMSALSIRATDMTTSTISARDSLTAGTIDVTNSLTAPSITTTDLTATNINATDSLTATNINATDITTNTINGYNLGMNDNFYNLPAIPVINSDLSMEVGKYLDFHNSASNDYDGRIHFATYAFHCSHSLYIDNGCKLTAANVISDKGNLNDVITKISSFTVTHETGANEELIVGTFCETDGTIYEKYKDNIKPTDCICNIKQSTSMNKNIIGVTVSTDPIKFATHGDVLLKVVNDTYNVGDILVPGQGGYGKKPSSDEIMSCLLNRIPTAKIISLDTGIDNEVACILL